MAKTWLVSDRHLWHDNIIKYCKRPFKDGAEMTEALRTYHNELVKDGDLVYDLGDVTMMRHKRQEQMLIDEQLKWNGRWHLFLGNHDHFDTDVYLKAGFKRILGTGQWFANMWMGHFPVHPQSMGRGVACVHGHTHDWPDFDPVITSDGLIKPYFNISIERTNYRPIELDDLIARVEKLNAQA